LRNLKFQVEKGESKRKVRRGGGERERRRHERGGRGGGDRERGREEREGGGRRRREGGRKRNERERDDTCRERGTK